MFEFKSSLFVSGSSFSHLVLIENEDDLHASSTASRWHYTPLQLLRKLTGRCKEAQQLVDTLAHFSSRLSSGYTGCSLCLSSAGSLWKGQAARMPLLQLSRSGAPLSTVTNNAALRKHCDPV